MIAYQSFKKINAMYYSVVAAADVLLLLASVVVPCYVKIANTPTMRKKKLRIFSTSSYALCKKDMTFIYLLQDKKSYEDSRRTNSKKLLPT